MNNADISSYTNRFNDLMTLCLNFKNLEYNNVERYIWRLGQPIQGLVTTSQTTTYDSAKRLAYNLNKKELRQGTLV